ncbi:uncharacterized protein LOC5496617 [Nematostella vectensis]|uniref:uncharacterized protein LOC5496617 n=1 Tax=Nematostella vectensis TaxID=45351 RepID=UPI002077817D|nr:uncharacterized protein LOC5496617 [Nematostella vectensis]
MKSRMERVARIAVFLCLIVLLQEVRPTHLASFPSEKRVEVADQDIEDDEDYSTEEEDSALKPQKTETQKNSNRSFFSRGVRFFSNLFKGAQITGKFLNVVSSGAVLVNEIIRAVDGCGGDAKKYYNEYNKTREEVEALITETDGLTLSVQNANTTMFASLDRFVDSVNTLNKIGESQLKYLESLSPEVRNRLRTATAEARAYVNKMNELKEVVEYSRVNQFYRSALENVMAIGTPAFAMTIPIIETLVSFCQKSATGRATAKQLSRQNAIKFKGPSRSNRNLWKTQRLGAITTKLNNAKTMKTSKLGKAKRFAGALGKGFLVAFDFATAGFNIKTLYDQIKQCQKLTEETKKSRDKMMETKKLFEQGKTNLTNAQNEILKTSTTIYGNMTDEDFITNVEQIRDMLSKLSETSGDDRFSVQTGKLQKFLDSVEDKKLPSRETDMYNTINNDLLIPLKDVPISYSCYIRKNGAMNDVLNSCKDGVKSLDALLEEKFGLTGDENDSEKNCNKKIGEYISKENVKEMWNKKAKNENLNPECILNNENSKQLICLKAEIGKKAKDIKEEGMDASEEAIQKVIDTCPSSVRSAVPEEVKNTICTLKNDSDLKLPQMIAAFSNYPASAVQDVYDNCPPKAKRRDKTTTKNKILETRN